MANYTWKMWNIPGDELQTSMVWADRFRHAYTKGDEPAAARGLSGYDPMKFEDHTLGKGIAFQVYPKHGWNAVWSAMVARSTVVRDRIVGIRDEHRRPYVLTASGETILLRRLPHGVLLDRHRRAVGREHAPLHRPHDDPAADSRPQAAFPEGAESLHYSSCEFQTRVTEMKVITRHDSPDTLILIEVPVLPGSAAVVSPQRDRARAREQPVRRKGLPAAIGTGVRDLPSLRRSRRQNSQSSVCRAPRRVQVLGNAGDRQRRVSEGSGLPAGLMHRILASTTSHKPESLPAMLDVFARLGMIDLDLNLHHFVEARRIGRNNRARRRAEQSACMGRVRRMVRLLSRPAGHRATPCGRSIGRSKSPADLAPADSALLRPSAGRVFTIRRPRRPSPQI